MSYPLGPPPPGPPPGWSPPTIPPGGFPPYHGPRKSYLGLVVGLLLVGFVATAALAAGIVLVVRNGDDGDKQAGGPAGSPAPTAPPPSTAEPTTPPPSSPEPSSPEPGPAVAGDVDTAAFPGDWDFKLGDVELRANLQESRDHASCAPVEKGDLLSRQGCQYAVQWVYGAQQGKVRQTHLFLVFDDEEHAEAVQRKLKDTHFDLPIGSTLPTFTDGKWKASVYRNILGVTIGTSSSTLPGNRLSDLVSYMNTDYRLALAAR